VLRGGTDKPSLNPALVALVEWFPITITRHVSPAATVNTIPLISTRAEPFVDWVSDTIAYCAAFQGALTEITLFTEAISALITLPAEKALENVLEIRFTTLCRNPLTEVLADPAAENARTEAVASALVTLPVPPVIPDILLLRASITACNPVAEPPPAEVQDTLETALFTADATLAIDTMSRLIAA